MKKTLTMLSALLLGAALYNASAGIIITLDENGNGTWNNNGTITSLTYGAFAIFPLGLTWIYLTWWITLTGAVLVANLPDIRSGFIRVIRY